MSADEHLSDDQFGQLQERLLSKGGTRVPNPGYEPDFGAIMERGQDWEGKTATSKRMKPSSCHGNTARLATAQGHGIATGYALSNDDVWRQHSWGIHKDTGKPIETTVRRSKYHGAVLTGDDAAAFIKANPY